MTEVFVSSEVEPYGAKSTETMSTAMTPIRGLDAYRRAVLAAERATRPALVRLFGAMRMREDGTPIENPLVDFVSRHVQNFIWTHQRLFAKLNRGNGVTATAASASAPCDVAGPRIFIDMTGTSRFYSFGGIARVANKISDEAIRTGSAIPVFIEDGRLRRAKSATKDIVSPQAGDTYVIVDTFWYPIDEYKAVIATLKDAGVFVVTFVHDVIPAQHPAFMGSSFPAYFTRCLFEMVARSDLLLSISQASAADVGRFLALHAPELADTPIETVQLGSDSVLRASGDVRRAFAAIFDQGTAFVTVGTICPHKGQFLALTAFDHLWAEGHDLRLVLVGKAEPAFRGIARSIRQHPQFGKRLFWYDDANDAELAFAYRSATCLVQPSIAEGFGVPVVEAQAAGLPVLANDIPVFHEIGGDEIAYFDFCDSIHLAEMVRRSASLPRRAPKQSMRTWGETLSEIVAAADALPRRSQA